VGGLKELAVVVAYTAAVVVSAAVTLALMTQGG
jgi:hypothetical protein